MRIYLGAIQSASPDPQAGWPRRREAGGGQEEGEQEGEGEGTHPSGGELASVRCRLEVRRRSGTSGGWPVTVK